MIIIINRQLHLYFVDFQGPISVSDINLPAGSPGCQTDNFKYQQSAGKLSWKDMTEDGKVFLVIFDIRKILVVLSMVTEK